MRRRRQRMFCPSARKSVCAEQPREPAKVTEDVISRAWQRSSIRRAVGPHTSREPHEVTVPVLGLGNTAMARLCWTLLLAVTSYLVFEGQHAEGARILAVFPIPSISHQVVFRALSLELSRRGHQLVVVTPDPVRDPQLANYTEVDVSCMYKPFRETNNFSSGMHEEPSAFEVFSNALLSGDDMCETIMSHEKVRQMIDPENTKEHFDLVILEWVLTPCTAAFAHRFSAPMIGITSLPPMALNYDSVGNPTNPSYIPEIAFPYTDKSRTFWQRLETVIFQIRLGHLFYNKILPSQDAIAKKYFGQSTPYIGDLYTQVSMLFVTYVQGFHPPRPNVPAVVNINGFNIRPPKPLPKDIQEFLDGAPKGVIYFSLGSNVRSDQLTADKRQVFLEVFAELPDYRVLWKWEQDNLPGQPRNVKIAKWLPQQDILRHPKVKIFITQGGLQSTEEAIHAKVPMISIPVFGDQYYNTKLGEDAGVALHLKLNELTKMILLEALKKCLENKSYQDNMDRMHAIVNDQQTTPMERAVWWTEYVLRHKGAQHLRTAAVDMPWYSYLLLDVALFFLATAALFVVLLSMSVKFIFSRLKTHFHQKQKTN
ncbi:UDP-glycosyltransferase UGT5-like [Bacillus rossius redtenbacheri]|uniref:UDP-glycosyltransferase UGT5-like n=1 Tax=Bacillus rossius redtenbacheri TaxID=93214 RepID=UPI002FDCBEF1